MSDDLFSKFDPDSLAELTRLLKLPRQLGGGLDLSTLTIEPDEHRLTGAGFQSVPSTDIGKIHDLTNHEIKIPLTSLGLPQDGVLNNSDFSASTYDHYPGNIYLLRSGLKDPEHTHATLQILRIQYDSMGRITQVTQNVSSGLLRCFFEELPCSPTIELLKTGLGLGAPNEADHIEHHRLVQESKESLNLDAEIDGRTITEAHTVLHESNFASKSVLSISQGEYGVICSNQTTTIEGTFGAGPCIIVGVSAEDKVGIHRVIGLTHIDGMTDEIGTLKVMLQDVKNGFGEEGLGAYRLIMKGGDSSSQQQIRTIYRQLRALEQTDPKCSGLTLMDVNDSGKSSLAIDCGTGDFHCFVPDQSLDHNVIPAMGFGKQIARKIYPKQ